MITIKVGNLLLANEDIIGHQVNCFKINRGIARQIIDKYPIVLHEFNEIISNCNNIEMLGKCQLVSVGIDKYIANLFSQYRYGLDREFTRYDCLHDALSELKFIAQFHNHSIALPYYIGSSRGGGNLEIVHDIIKDVFWDYNVSLYRLK